MNRSDNQLQQTVWPAVVAFSIFILLMGLAVIGVVNGFAAILLSLALSLAAFFVIWTNAKLRQTITKLAQFNTQLQHDIAQRKRSDEALRQAKESAEAKSEQLATLNRITQAVVSAHDLHAALQVVAREMVQLFAARNCGIALLNQERTGLEVVVDYSTDPDYPSAIGIMIPLENNPSSLRVVETKTSLVIPQAQTNPLTAPIHGVMKARGTHCLMLVPLLARGAVIGTIGMALGQSEREFSQSEVALAETVAGQIAGAVESVRLFDEEQRQRHMVEERTEELSEALEDLQTTQQELIQSEKMAALGQLIAGIAHEINTPLGAIRASISTISDSLPHTIAQLPQLFSQLSPARQADFVTLLQSSLTNEARLSSRQERKLRRAMQRKLEALDIDEADAVADTLTDMGIYDEPTRFIKLLQDEHRKLALQIAYQLSLQGKSSQNIAMAVEKAAKVVFALKSYARHDRSDEATLANVVSGIDVVLTIYYNQLKQGIEVVTRYEDDLPEIMCYPDELNQVWTNLIHNAVQAMDGNGCLEIAVFTRSTPPNCVIVEITDSGSGIPPEIQSRIFEPFFTTKGAGEGSGLGLDIVKSIVEKHQGQIEFTSQPGKTCFTVILPLNAVQIKD